MEKPLAVQAPQQITTGDLIAATLQSGITESTVAVVERLCALREREAASQAERDLACAFVKLQSIMPQIVACKAVPGNDGKARYKFAPYEEIMTKAKPALTECGFGITFDTDIADGRITATCTLVHVGGGKLSKKFACRIGTGPPKASEAQIDGAATSYAKRFALCAALNIVVENDTDGTDDARNIGSLVTQEQADELRRRAKACGANETNLLAYLTATDYEQVPANRYADAITQIEKKEAKMVASTPARKMSDEELKKAPDLGF